MLFGQKILAFCTSKLHQNYFCDFIAALNSELISHNWRIFIFCSSSDLGQEDNLPQGGKNIFDLVNWDITDALLLSDEEMHDQQLKEKLISTAQSKNIPIISLNGLREDIYQIKFNQQAGFEQVCRHIIEGHHKRKLHFMAGTKTSRQSIERLETFKAILKENKIPYRKEMVSYGDFWDLPARIATQKMVDSGELPEAIICANDTMAITVTSVLQQNGYDVPEDILVSGFDGIDAAFFSNPKITTSLCDNSEFGLETARFIIQITEQKIPVCTKYVAPSLVVSESCGCKPIKQTNTLSFFNFLSESYTRYRVEDYSLSSLSVSIQECRNIDEVKNVLKNQLLYNVMCLVKTEVIDHNVDPNITHTSSTYGNVQYVLLDSDMNDQQNAENQYIKTEELIPRMKEVLKRQIPLIFTPLNNANLALGYLCFSFNNFDKQNYAKVSQIASWVGTALSSYRNLQFLRQLQTQVEKMYSHDTLTGLYNRIGFQKIYKKVMDDPEVTTISLAMCDLDNLKYINDNFSHNEGDEAINTVGKALSSAIPDGYFCRYGGDEIIGLYTKKINGTTLNKKIDEFLKDYNETSRKPYNVSTSVGVYTSEKISFEEMFGKADKLMYEQKVAKRKNRGK